MLTKIKLSSKQKLYSLLSKLYAPIFDQLKKPIGGGGLEMLLRKEIFSTHKIISLHQTIELLTREKKIFIRLGDGELPILHKKNGGFHTYTQELRERLLESYYFALNSRDFLLGVNPDLIYPFTHPNDPHLISSCRNYQIMDFVTFFPIQDYANAMLLRTSPVTLYHEKYNLENYQELLLQSFLSDFYRKNQQGIKILDYYKQTLIEPLKKLWKNKHVIICEGKFSAFGVYNDLLEYASSIQRVQAQNSNAFSNYQEILTQAIKQANPYQQDEVYFIFALGHTSKILLIDLYQKGFKNGIDAGNLSIAYDSFLHNFPYTWIDDPIQTIQYPPLYYGKKLKPWEKKSS